MHEAQVPTHLRRGDRETLAVLLLTSLPCGNQIGQGQVWTTPPSV